MKNTNNVKEKSDEPFFKCDLKTLAVIMLAGMLLVNIQGVLSPIWLSYATLLVEAHQVLVSLTGDDTVNQAMIYMAFLILFYFWVICSLTRNPTLRNLVVKEVFSIFLVFSLCALAYGMDYIEIMYKLIVFGLCSFIVLVWIQVAGEQSNDV